MTTLYDFLSPTEIELQRRGRGDDTLRIRGVHGKDMFAGRSGIRCVESN